MKQKLLLKSMLLLFALIAGSSSAWADGDPNWTGTVANTTSKLNTNDKTYTFTVSEVDYVWSYAGTTVAKGSPSVSIGTSSGNNAIKLGSSKDNYYKPVIFTTEAFSDKAVTKVRLYLKHNGSKVGSLTVKQGSTTIGTATTSQTADWISVVCSETNKGAGGTLEIRYEVDQALYINKIEVWYEDLGTATTTTINSSGITNTDVYVSTAAGSLSASVTEKVGGAAVGGATVTWTSSNPAVATIASDGTVTLKHKGSTTIIASYAGNATYAASSAEYVLNVTSSAPQETDIIVTTNYEWLGVEDKASITGSKVIDCEGVTVTIDPDDGTKTRGDDTYIRLYAKNIMTFTAPANYLIKEINFTKANDKWDNTFNVDAGTWNNTDLKWTGLAQEVTLTEAGSSGNNQFSQMEIKLVAYVAITPAKEYTTLTSAKALDFTGLTGLEAYIATEVSGGSVLMTQVNKVPANTGLVLKATTPGSAVNVPVFDGTGADNVSANKMAGSATETTAIAANGGYILKDGVFQPALAGTLPAGKAYLNIAVPAGAPILNLGFDDATGIESIAKSQELTANGQYYNLAGQRVAQHTKALYIVNGKKYILK